MKHNKLNLFAALRHAMRRLTGHASRKPARRNTADAAEMLLI